MDPIPENRSMAVRDGVCAQYVRYCGDVSKETGASACHRWV